MLHELTPRILVRSMIEAAIIEMDNQENGTDELAFNHTPMEAAIQVLPDVG